MVERGGTGLTPVQVVLALYDAVRDRRVGDLLTLVAPEVTCKPLVRPGLTVYRGHGGMTRLIRDMHAVHGSYQVEIAEVAEQPGPQVTVRARIVPEPGYGQPIPVSSVYTLHDGLITSAESHPGLEIPGPG